MRLLLIFLLFLVSPMAAADGFKILFVGNSLTYYNDVPRAVAALLEAEGTHREVEVEMLAEGGATLDQHLQGAAFDRTLKAFAPDVVVLPGSQLRGLLFMIDYNVQVIILRYSNIIKGNN